MTGPPWSNNVEEKAHLSNPTVGRDECRNRLCRSPVSRPTHDGGKQVQVRGARLAAFSVYLDNHICWQKENARHSGTISSHKDFIHMAPRVSVSYGSPKGFGAKKKRRGMGKLLPGFEPGFREDSRVPLRTHSKSRVMTTTL